MKALNIIKEILAHPGRLKTYWSELDEWIWSYPSDGESKLRESMRGLLRILLIFFREFDHDRIPLRASALTFTIVLSLVPTLALGTAVLKGLGAGDQVRQAAYRLIDQLDRDGGGAVHELEAGEFPGTPVQKTQPASLTDHLRKATDQIFDYVDKTDFTTLGAFGIIGLVLAVMSVLGSIEKSMNAIWLAKSGRPLGRKVMDYLALMILLPVTINVAFATEATIQSPALLNKVAKFLPVPGLKHLVLTMLPILLVIATFSILYRFLPNTRVRLLPATVGGIFGGLLWFLTQVFYLKLQIGVARYNAIYGSFATLPLFLIWLQLGWIIFLSGAEMAFAVQHWRGYDPKNRMLTPIARLALAFNIVETVYVAFKRRHLIDLASLARRLQQPEIALQGLLDELLKAGILRHINDDREGYVPSSPAGSIPPMEIVDLILGTEVPPFRGSSLALETLNAARKALEGKKIGISTE
jgi:membrane protein